MKTIVIFGYSYLFQHVVPGYDVQSPLTVLQHKNSQFILCQAENIRGFNDLEKQSSITKIDQVVIFASKDTNRILITEDDGRYSEIIEKAERKTNGDTFIFLISKRGRGNLEHLINQQPTTRQYFEKKRLFVLDEQLNPFCEKMESYLNQANGMIEQKSKPRQANLGKKFLPLFPLVVCACLIPFIFYFFILSDNQRMDLQQKLEQFFWPPTPNVSTPKFNQEYDLIIQETNKNIESIEKIIIK